VQHSAFSTQHSAFSTQHSAVSIQHSAFSHQPVGRRRRFRMKDFRDLDVWTKSHAITLDVYRATADFPREELYGLTSQMRRCSASIPANIAEGCGRRGNGEFHRFLTIAMGSASELEYHLLLSHDLEFLRLEKFEALTCQVQEIKKMLASLIRRVDVERNRSLPA
jgi:four helix bundle protein